MRSVNDQTPIFDTLYTKANARTAAATIADELKKRIAAVSASRKAKK